MVFVANKLGTDKLFNFLIFLTATATLKTKKDIANSLGLIDPVEIEVKSEKS